MYDYDLQDKSFPDKIAIAIILAALFCLLVVPIWLLWNWLAPIYFTFLPTVWLHLPYTHVLGLLVLYVFLFGRWARPKKA